MHGLPYIQQSNLAAANAEAQGIIEANKAAGIPEKKAAEFEANIAEATARLAATDGDTVQTTGAGTYQGGLVGRESDGDNVQTTGAGTYQGGLVGRESDGDNVQTTGAGTYQGGLVGRESDGDTVQTTGAGTSNAILDNGVVDYS